MSGAPWLSSEVLEFLERHVQPDHRVFEWGSGGSTIFFAERAKQVVSVENWPDWYDKVKGWLDARQLTHVQLLLRPADEGRSQDIRNPDAYASHSAGFKHQIFRSYAREIDQHPGLFDLVVVDGRARGSCLKHARRRVRVGGAVLLDDSERGWYKRGWAAYSEPDWKTTVLKGKGNGLTAHVFTRLR
jgi:hypothetical protein